MAHAKRWEKPQRSARRAVSVRLFKLRSPVSKWAPSSSFHLVSEPPVSAGSVLLVADELLLATGV